MSAAICLPVGLACGPALPSAFPVVTALPRRQTAGLRRCRRSGRCCASSGPQAWRYDDLSGGPSGSLGVVSSFDDLWQEQIRAMQRAQSEMAEMQRQMDQVFESAQREAAQLERQAGSSGRQVEQIGGAGGPCGYRWQRSEQHEGPGGSFRSYRSESFTVIGVPGGCSSAYAPPPATQLGALPGMGLLLVAALAGFWAAATAAFNRRFGLTVYKEQSRWWMLLLWPLLLLFNSEFRQQFWAAVRGRQAGGRVAEGDGFIGNAN